ncbi:hypothetical protein Osc7112_0860 [Oscillatoria nigro-viridis PCC 7112]|uniref:Uncharacterized protein n=1 Tax=Phormidium nigroviride PCC 7112 TaxID=179408 RepID=K9VBF0_9CYAN|nr:hypothetical protein Osc7112_0860 [Oscillatoria nigro-viridis PCC 7112]
MSGKIYNPSGLAPISTSRKYVFLLRFFAYLRMLGIVELRENFVK